jgi:hypothetical protein
MTIYEMASSHKQTRKDAQAYINTQRQCARRGGQQPHKTRQRCQRIERMPQPLPTRQPAPPMKVKLTYRHTKRLQAKWDEQKK